ncbi:hypothetical protein HMPREF9209_0102 [Lactobacillus gasseri 224-1]|uniref:Uncharacterized protein n=1 Tax=Lactobacillus gasseri 224-1 TaxID=679196 RepID=D1YJ20_LACGS|nr:hypothetical protein HMPREF9209_0102 [Lactobacillus gasseri 224-1]
MIKYKEFALEDIFCKIKSPKIKGKAADFPTTKKAIIKYHYLQPELKIKDYQDLQKKRLSQNNK